MYFKKLKDSLSSGGHYYGKWFLTVCLVASWNQYNDLIESTDNSPIIPLGYNYLLNGQKLKLMLDNEVQLSSGKLRNYFATLQLQLFFK